MMVNLAVFTEHQLVKDRQTKTWLWYIPH